MSPIPERAGGSLEDILDRLDQLEALVSFVDHESNATESTDPSVTVALVEQEGGGPAEVDPDRIRVSEVVPSLGLESPSGVSQGAERIVAAYTVARRKPWSAR